MVPGLLHHAARIAAYAGEHLTTGELDAVDGRRVREAEVRQFVVAVGKWPLILPAHAEIQREFLVQLPVVLQVQPIIQLLVFVAVLVGVAPGGRQAQFE